MMIIQLPTGKTARVDPAWWYSLSDEEVEAFYAQDHGSEIDPLAAPIPHTPDEPDSDPSPQHNFFTLDPDD